MTGFQSPATSPELLAAIERARNHKMTPQEIFEQRVSFVSEGVNKDEVRKRLIEQCGYPAEASERAAIVKWLHQRSLETDKAYLLIASLADEIERGEHLK